VDTRFKSQQQSHAELEKEIARGRDREAELRLLYREEQKRVLIEQSRFYTLQRQVESQPKAPVDKAAMLVTIHLQHTQNIILNAGYKYVG
jgi:hypothetical protein